MRFVIFLLLMSCGNDCPDTGLTRVTWEAVTPPNDAPKGTKCWFMGHASTCIVVPDEETVSDN
jgi:hypothetical protein